jgi:hypothetical protein
MKKISVYLLLAMCALGYAQNEEFNNVITLNGGVSAVSKVQCRMFYGDNWKDYQYGYNKSSSPSFGIDWDYGLGDRVSIGVYFKYAQTRSEKIHADPAYYYPTFKSQAYAFGGRCLFHFYKKQKKSDVYAGLGLGIVGWGHQMNPEDIYFLVSAQEVLNVQVPIVIGYRYYFKERLAGTAELSTSFMSKINIGLSYRFSAL